LSESGKMESYELSQAADNDFETIFEYGIDTFGLDQALEYQYGMKQRFEELAKQPKLYQSVGHIHTDYRRSVYGKHSIYYRIESKGIRIMRILKHQDPAKAL